MSHSAFLKSYIRIVWKITFVKWTEQNHYIDILLIDFFIVLRPIQE
jgi:hypothetical protein